MARRGLTLLIVFAACAATSAAPPRRIERAPEFVQRVNAAIDRGVAWLKKAQSAVGAVDDFPQYPGATTALAYYTMRVCGVASDDPAARAAWTSMKRAYRRTELKTYSASVFLMAISEHGTRAPAAKDEHDVTLGKDDAKWAAEIAHALAGGQNGDGTWGYLVEGSNVPRGLAQMPDGRDHSNTQYALLGLKCAARCGVAVDPSVWSRSLVHFAETQEASGPEVPRGLGPRPKGGTNATMTDRARGWCYRGRAVTPQPGGTSGGAAETPRPPYAAMTAGAVGSIVLCRSELLGMREMSPELDAGSERAVWDGLAWLGTNWNPTAPLVPGPEIAPRIRDAMGTGLSQYEFYAVERAGVLAAVDWMGETDWYGAGAAALLDTQAPDGSWMGLNPGLVIEDLDARKAAMRPVDTCFALLFLKRGTTPVRLGAVTGGGDDADINFDEAAKLTGGDLDDFVELILARWRRASDAEVRRRLFDGATATGPRIVEPLLVRLDAGDAALREAAHALLRHATGLEFGFDAAGSRGARDEAVMKWQEWWMTTKDRIVYDPAAKRLVER